MAVMDSTLDVVLQQVKEKAEQRGGSFADAVRMLERSLVGNDIMTDIQSIVDKHEDMADVVGGDFKDMMQILKNFVS